MFATLGMPGDADAGIISEVKDGFSEGGWRAEVNLGAGIRSGRQSRSGDVLVAGNIEYEFPIYARATLGLKAYPLFSYNQDDGSTGQDLLPNISPTFEWIRLAQRIPVRVQLENVPDSVQLRVGTTASVMVRTGTADE